MLIAAVGTRRLPGCACGGLWWSVAACIPVPVCGSVWPRIRNVFTCAQVTCLLRALLQPLPAFTGRQVVLFGTPPMTITTVGQLSAALEDPSRASVCVHLRDTDDHDRARDGPSFAGTFPHVLGCLQHHPAAAALLRRAPHNNTLFISSNYPHLGLSFMELAQDTGLFDRIWTQPKQGLPHTNVQDAGLGDASRSVVRQTTLEALVDWWAMAHCDVLVSHSRYKPLKGSGFSAASALLARKSQVRLTGQCTPLVVCSSRFC